MTRFESVVEAIGGTPLIRLTKTGLAPRIYVKPEWYNPGGSVKDRAALSMIRAAEADGRLRAGGTVVETTSGNTGIGLALYAAFLGYRAVIFTSSGISKEKRDLLTAHGAELRLVDAFVPKGHPDSLKSIAERFVAETPGAWLANQYDNPANPAAHYRSTGPEIWADTEGAVTHLVSTVGTGGTISGTARYLKEVSGGGVHVVGADPLTSSYSGGDGSQKFIEGAGHAVHPLAETDEWPESLDLAVIDEFVAVDDRTAIDAIRELARTEGILAGGSAGVALAAGLRLAARLDASATVVILLPDSGRAYLSTYYNDGWLLTNGFRTDEDPLSGRRPAGGTASIDHDATADDAVAQLEAASVADDEPVLVVYRRSARTTAPHSSDVAGWTTLAELRDAAAVADIARAGAPKLGAGQSPQDALATANAAEPGWSVALLLTDGRVTGLIARAELEALVAAPARA